VFASEEALPTNHSVNLSPWLQLSRSSYGRSYFQYKKEK
jgi:hypothetical protein